MLATTLEVDGFTITLNTAFDRLMAAQHHAEALAQLDSLSEAWDASMARDTYPNTVRSAA